MGDPSGADGAFSFQSVTTIVLPHCSMVPPASLYKGYNTNKMGRCGRLGADGAFSFQSAITIMLPHCAMVLPASLYKVNTTNTMGRCGRLGGWDV